MAAVDECTAGASAEDTSEISIEMPAAKMPNEAAAPSPPQMCVQPEMMLTSVMRPALQETLESWMTRHEDSLRKLVERLEATVCIERRQASLGFERLDMEPSQGIERLEASPDMEQPAKQQVVMTSNLSDSGGEMRVQMSNDVSNDGDLWSQKAQQGQRDEAVVHGKTMRSMSDLFTTDADTKKRKTKMILQEETGMGLVFRKEKSFVPNTPISVRDLLDPSTGVVQQRFKLLVDTTAFQVWSAAMICVSVVVIGVDVEHEARDGSNMAEIAYVMIMLNLWYILEVAIRIAAFGKGFFMNDEDKKWNLFDLALACLSMVELVVGDSSAWGTGILRGIRVVRPLRCLRLARFLAHLQEFRKMVFSMLISIQTLFWAVVLLLFFLYFFSIWFTSACSQYLRDHPEEQGGVLDGYFGSLPLSMFSLWLSISGGLNWYYVVMPLFKVDKLLVGFFVAFIATMLLGVLNIVTAVFVESAMRSTQHYRDLMLEEKAIMKDTLSKHLRQIFHQMDQDASGMISLDEMQVFLEDESLELQQYFEALEVNANDAKALFKLLDRDGSGEIDIDEFSEGCMRLKGHARSFDINCLLFKTQRLDSRLLDIGKGLDTLIGLCQEISCFMGLSRGLAGVRSPPKQECSASCESGGFA